MNFYKTALFYVFLVLSPFTKQGQTNDTLKKSEIKLRLEVKTKTNYDEKFGASRDSHYILHYSNGSSWEIISPKGFNNSPLFTAVFYCPTAKKQFETSFQEYWEYRRIRRKGGLFSVGMGIAGFTAGGIMAAKKPLISLAILAATITTSITIYSISSKKAVPHYKNFIDHIKATVNTYNSECSY